MTDDYEAALQRLPEAHALALRLTAAGVCEEEICARLGIEAEGLAPLLEIAQRKLHKELSRKQINWLTF
jgi:hypothetical protein